LIKGIIFDFDGVIAESIPMKTNAFATLYSDNGADIIQRVVSHHEANGGMSRFEKIKYYHKTFLNITLTEKEIMELADRFSILVIGKVTEAPYVDGALEYIQNIFNKYKLFISTGTPTNEMKQILKGRKIAHYFTEVFGSPAKKSVHVSNILNNYNLDSNELIFYGDSKTDLDAAKHANIPFVLIKNRYNQTLSASFRGKIINNFIGIL